MVHRTESAVTLVVSVIWTDPPTRKRPSSSTGPTVSQGIDGLAGGGTDGEV